MKRTTVYLPDELKRRVERTARERRQSEAEVIRAALDAYTVPLARRRPTLPLFAHGDVAPVEDWDEAMRSFGAE
jgi:hypothetical protein